MRTEPARPPRAPLDRRFMRAALKLARSQLGLTTPNPSVGCVIVRGGRIVGRGATAAGGRPHAETIALTQAGDRARNATAYVTLEPCAHRGATGPCARALIEAKVARVVIGCLDPYPPVRGRGVSMLRRAGIEVTAGVLEAECRAANEGFITRVTRRRPFALLKLAMTLDGRIAAGSGDSKWISSDESRALVHGWRRECDAIVVGAGTIAADNPRLTCRSENPRDPVRVIIDPKLRTDPHAMVYVEKSDAPAIVVTTRANLLRARRRYAGERVETIAAPQRGREIDLAALMAQFGERGWCRVMFEGGARTAASALSAGVIDRVALFVAPLIAGAGISAVQGLATELISDSIRLGALSVTRIGSDLLIQGEPLARRKVR